MKFLYPLGLLGLIGIPILILVYIIKNRYTEQTVSSTYLWSLSERFLKKRNPLSKITGIISLILQLLLVLTLSLAVAHPILIIPGGADEYCFILDGSGSMQTEIEGKSRFDLAKEEILRVMDEAKNGSVFSLIYVSDMTRPVFEREDDRELIRERLALLEPADGSVTYADALGTAQRYFNENPSVLTYLVTDTDHSEHQNINLINVSRRENNISLEDLAFASAGNDMVTVSGNLISYGADRETDVEIYSNLTPNALESEKIFLPNGVKTPFSITVSAGKFYSLTARLTAEDALAADNSATVYSLESENAYRALLVSDTPFLLQSAIEAVSVADLTVMTEQEYEDWVGTLASRDEKVSGYGLYIFDAYDPASVPADGSVWFLGPRASVENAGFSIQGEVELDEGVRLELNKSSNSVMQKLTAGMMGEDVFVKKYMKCGLYGSFSTIFSYMGNPIVFTGTGEAGNRQVVFAFNLHDSNFAMTSDCLILLHNLLDYSFPAVIERTEYDCGEMAQINVLPGCDSIRIEAPSGRVSYGDTSSAISEFLLSEVGEYRMVLDMSGTERAFYIYSSMPMEERYTDAPSDVSVSIRGEAADEGRDGMVDPFVLILILAALFFTAEWMVYCYDKYQFR